MKTRIIQTRFWNDEIVYDLSWQSKFVFIYLLASDSINMSGLFQLPDKKILIETGITSEDLQIAKDELTLNKKVLFKKGWIYVVNSFKNNNYTNTVSNIDVWQTELSRIPPDVMSYFDSTVDSSVYSTQIQIQKQNLIKKENKEKERKDNMMSKEETDQMLKEVDNL
jgi:hypothetical protein